MSRGRPQKSDLPKKKAGRDHFLIVGVGASAGGLEAFTELLKHLPADTGLGFVLVQHLDPKHQSALTDLLGRVTSMPVREVTNNLRVEPNHVYIIPPNKTLGITQGILKLHPRQQNQTSARCIDAFFESLAQDQRERAIGVVLSGTATDGTLGLEMIKAEGGITFAQDHSARYDSMPRSAIAAGCVDFVLSPEKIARELASIANHPYAAGWQQELASEVESPESAKDEEERQGPLSREARTMPSAADKARGEHGLRQRKLPENGFKKTLALLGNHSGVDFSLYKPTTVLRRLTRRMVLNKKATLNDYASFLRGNAKELDDLYSDMLIGVTSFFRNPEAFEVLKHKVFPKLLRQRGDEPVRVWVLGCSTGQEAYSIVMTYLESAQNAPRTRELQVFATDLNEALLEKARQALYTKALAQDVSPERLRRFFVEEEGGYRVAKPFREMVVFARQNLITDSPFSHLDLISCRNLLIYLESGLQKKLIPTFHYALKPDGFLLLGASESIGGYTGLFEQVDRKNKIFVRKAAPTQVLHLAFRKVSHERLPQANKSVLSIGKRSPEPLEGFRAELSAQREADRVLAKQFAPPGVLINGELQILQFRGQTGAYLQPPATGKATFDILKMAREGLMLPLHAVIKKATKQNRTVRKKNVRIERSGRTRTVNLQVIPLRNLRERCFLVLFEDAEEGRDETVATPSPESLQKLPTGKKETADRINVLETELSETREYLQSVQEQHEAANEELQASNEEVQSANEELQSINEELQTSKEELESANEELTTLNEEMGSRNGELNLLNADLTNLQTSIKLPILVLGRDLTVRRFSALAEKVFKLAAGDVGRPLSAARHNLTVCAPAGTKDTAQQSDAKDAVSFSIEEFARQVIDTVHEQEREVRDKAGRWYSVRGRPYMTVDNKVDGAVLLLVDITELKQTQHEVAMARDYAEATLRTARDPLIVLRANFSVERANDAFYKTFKVTPQETQNVVIYQLGGGQWNIPQLRDLLEEIIPQNSFFNDFEVTHEFERIGRRTMLLNARRLDNPFGVAEKILLGIEDITDRQRASESQFAAIVQASEDAIFSKTLQNVITSWNPGAQRMFGYVPEEIVGKNISVLLAPEHKDDPELIVEQLRRGERITNFETQGLRKDKSIAWLLWNVSPILDSSGQLTGASIIARDITHHKQAEEALKAVNDQLAADLAGLQRLQEISTVLIHGGDIATLYRKILDAAITLMGADMGSMQRFYPDRDELRLLVWTGLEPESASFWQCVGPNSVSICGVALRTGQRVIVDDLDACEFLAATQDLEAYRKSGIRAVQSTPLISRSGQIVGMISNHWRQPHQPEQRELRLLDLLARQAADLIERSQAEQARAHLASIVEFSDDAIISKDLDGVITSWNQGAERLFGYTAQEAIGRPVTFLMPPDRVDEEPGILERIRRGESIEHYETVRQRKDGVRIDVSLTVSPIKNDQGQIVGASKIARDIIERKRIETSLRQAQAQLADRAGQLEQAVSERTAELSATNKQLEAFIYSVAHDLRAPLRAMQGFSVMLAREAGATLSQTGQNYAERINKSAQFMDALLIDLLSLSRISQQRVELVPVSLENVIASLLARLEQDINEKSARVEAVGPWPVVMAHEPLLTQILFNLVANALKFVGPDTPPEVRIRAEEQPEFMRVWVEDNGIGIEPSHKEQVFRLFNRLHGDKYPGTGIGLAIVEKGVERMGGRAGVESILNQGSRFWIDLRKAVGH